MTDSNHLRSHTPSKYHCSPPPNKSQVLSWICSLLPQAPQHSLTIESLGNGAIYCQLINRYCPATILSSRIIAHPINEYENCLNLKQLQLGLAKLKIPIPLDIGKVSKQRFTQNWNLVTLLYKHFEASETRRALEANLALKRWGPELQCPAKEHLFNESKRTDNQENQGNAQMAQFSKGGLLHIVDRVKEILISNSNDTYKIRLISTLFGVGDQVKKEEPDQMFDDVALHAKGST